MARHLAPLRLVLVLAAVLGVAGMHAVGTGHAAHAVHAAHAAGAVQVAPLGHGAGDVDASVVGSADGADPDDGAGSLLHLCLAVVGAGVVLGAALVARRPWPASRPGGPGRAVRASEPSAAPLVTVPPWVHLSRTRLCLWRV
ncbi:hypothetical protein WDZ17_00790 [Pseudokineococcus basanitobsidens]|uniref:Uncharacterized protein n=1 Tax=Pseudokineococcus basanitobsidens TaxID=1926649 RepID=A0ABU8RFH3_9ACTN